MKAKNIDVHAFINHFFRSQKNIFLTHTQGDFFNLSDFYIHFVRGVKWQQEMLRWPGSLCQKDFVKVIWPEFRKAQTKIREGWKFC